MADNTTGRHDFVKNVNGSPDCGWCHWPRSHPDHGGSSKLRSTDQLKRWRSALYRSHVEAPCNIWRTLRSLREVFARGICEACGARGGPVCTAHLHYKTLGFEDLTDIAIVCPPCGKDHDRAPERYRKLITNAVERHITEEYELFRPLERLALKALVHESHACPLPGEWETAVWDRWVFSELAHSHKPRRIEWRGHVYDPDEPPF